MNKRREFFRKASIFGVAAIAPVATTVVVTMPEKEVEDSSHLAPPSTATSIRLTGMYEEPKRSNSEESMRLSSGGFFITSSPKPTHGVDMAVGKDNRLWLKVNEEWKRVAVEG